MTDRTAAGDALAERLDVLAGAYAFTARLWLAPPDPDLLARIADPALMGAWPVGGTVSREGAALLTADAAAGDVLDLARDYQRLFVGPGPLLAAPYESVHVTRDRLLFEEPTMRVRAAYRAFGLEAPALNREPDDHVGLELQFLGDLSVRALDAIDAGDDDRLDAVLAAHQDFLTRHLLVWAPDLLAAVGQHARTRFYRGVGLLTAGVLDHARAVLGA